jgi:uncharacterized delta-60 repeat protein
MQKKWLLLNKVKSNVKYFIIFLCLGSLNAQVTQQWVARYNGPGNNSDAAPSLAVDASGNVYVTGHSIGSGTDYDYGTIKYNTNGDSVWVRRYNGPGNGVDYSNSLAVDGSGNVYVTGRSFGSGTSDDYATIKYNSSGVQQWVARYNGPPGNRADYAYSLAVDLSGNVYVTGLSYGNGTNDDYATIKYNTNGDSVWVRRYNGPAGNGGDMAYSLAVDVSGNVYVTGASVGGGFDYATIKYNSSGVQQWVAGYNGPGDGLDQAYYLAVDISGNVYVTGLSFGSGTDYDYATIKYNSNGIQQWFARYNGTGNSFDAAYSLTVDVSGNVYVTGVSAVSGTSYDYDYATIKYNSNGDSVWVRRYNGPGNSDDWAFSLAVDGLGNVYVTGGSRGSGIGYDYATIKYNSNGDSVWVRRYNGPGNGSDQASSIAIGVLGNVYVTGSSFGNGTGYDYATIKYSQPVGIQLITHEIPESFSLSQNYPNPFNPKSKIKFEISKLSEAKLIIYDVLGKEIVALVNEQLTPGTYEVEWDASNYPSGVYYYKLTTGDFVETKKMVLIK